MSFCAFSGDSSNDDDDDYYYYHYYHHTSKQYIHIVLNVCIKPVGVSASG